MREDGRRRGTGFVPLGEVAMRIAEVVRLDRRRRDAEEGVVVPLETLPSAGPRRTIAALAILAEARVLDAGTGMRLLCEALEESESGKGSRNEPFEN